MTSSHHRTTRAAPDTGPGPTPPPVAGAWLGVEGARLHPRLEALLRRVQAAERAAAGEHRRPTFRLMRELLGASVRLGVSPRLLADCLGTSPRSLSARANSADNGTITAALIQQLTDLTPPELNRLSRGELPGPDDQTAHQIYRTTDFIRAVLKTPLNQASSAGRSHSSSTSTSPASTPAPSGH